MDYKFFLDALEIAEPIGWNDFELSIKRDDVYHGMQFEVSTSALRFFGVGAEYLRDQKELNGIKSNVTFIAQQNCDGIYEDVIQGRLNFGKYKERCGGLCIVEIPFEEEGCKVAFRNRFDQKVEMDSLIALDNTTVIANYAQLGQTIPIPAKALQAAVDGSVATDGYENVVDFSGAIPSGSTTYLRPDYEIERYNNILTGQLIGVNNCVSNSIFSVNCDGPITPQLLFEDAITCFDGNFNYESRKKGTINITDNTQISTIKHKIFKWDAVGDVFADHELVAEATIYDPGSLTPGPLALPFDTTLTGTITIPDGIGFYAVIEVIMLLTSGDSSITVDYDTDTHITIDAVKLCPATDAQYYLVHEALSRIAESITSNCIRVKSEYYGRIDSQPFAFTDDGCGSLRMLTSGLKLRNAPDAKFFISAKDLIAGLNAIDNIGFSIEPDTAIAGRMLLVVEPVEYFYKDFEMLSLDSIQEVTSEIQESLHYAKVNVGYKKWEVERVNGLNEFNSTREYRTNVETINTILDIQSNLVAGSYPIELTRQQSFAASGAADTTYDNEAFVICLTRNAYSFAVEQGNITNPANIFDPATVMNFRLSPVRNLMRWFKSIINTYPNINGSSHKLFFSAGTGNFIASGILNDTSGCRQENGVIPVTENMDVSVVNFATTDAATPLFKNETATFEYPLTIAQYKQIKANPYGYISYTCGTSATVTKAFIKEIKFRPARGMANFTLRKKMATIVDNKFDFGDVVFLKTDREQAPRIVFGIKMYKSGELLYELISGTVTSAHYEFEISTEKNLIDVL